MKLENILIGPDFKLKIADFRFVHDSDQLVKKCIGTLAYMAPEIHTHSKCGFKGKPADMFAVAVIYFVLVFGAFPFENSTYKDENWPNFH